MSISECGISECAISGVSGVTGIVPVVFAFVMTENTLLMFQHEAVMPLKFAMAEVLA